jgi:D-lactate dehydrogenase
LPRSPEADIVRELLTFPNVLFTPHNAFNTHEAVERKAAFTVTQVRHFLKHGDFLWKV